MGSEQARGGGAPGVPDNGGDAPAVTTFPATARFVPVALLGRGSMGVVYRAYDTETELEVALKTIGTHTPEQLYYLKQEFRLLAGIVHPNLVELYELFTDAVPFFTMELIDGVGFVDYVRRATGEADLARFTDAARQLAAGLAAVHAAGRLHRDVKPSNILVDRGGRVVLLDFGLATALQGEGAPHYAPAAAGTIGYMAPELLWGHPATPAADCYSVGVVLYEALTGRLPFDPLAAAPLTRGPRAAPAGSQRIVPDLPEPFAREIRALLHSDPRARPSAVELLHVAQDVASDRPVASREGAQRGASGSAQPTWTLGVGLETPFVGREAELGHLRTALQSLRSGRAKVVHVVGSSGIGKSELIRRFLRGAEGDDTTVILRGRCHPQEVVPYKAFDGVVDTLSRLLLSLPADAIAATLPAARGAVAQLFPVLGRVPAFGTAEPSLAGGDPHAVRRRGFAELRELLGRLARRRQLIVWIDDAQWGDSDSALLFRELLRGPDAPPVLWLLSYRSEDRDGMTLLADLPTDGDADYLTSTLEVGPLDVGQTRALVTQLSAAQVDADAQVAALVAEAAGNPFFIAEVVRALGAGRRATLPSLATLIAQRVAELPDTARRVLEVVCVAGRPLSRQVVLLAAGTGERGRPTVTQLERRSFLRTTFQDQGVAVEVYHDRIREALVAALSGDTVRARHGELADVLARHPEPDAEALFRHTLGAGRRQDAAVWADRAAERAAAALAFARAADLYAQALELQDAGLPRWELLTKRAEALANAGRAVDAAGAFESAADDRALQDPAPGAVVGLRQRAAMHYLQTGHLDRGLAVTRSVLDRVGIGYPRSPARALAQGLSLRTRLAWRGLGFTPRTTPLPASVRLRLDACWGAGITLTTVDQTLADALGVRYLLEALDAGDVPSIARALGTEAAKTAQIGGRFMRRRCERLLRLVRPLAETCDGAYERAHFHVCSGLVAFQAARWREAYEHLDTGAGLLRRQCVGVTWELVTTETFGLSALAQMGDLERLAVQLPLAIGNAEDRGDFYAQVLLHTGVLNLVWLAQDRPDEAAALADASMARWPAGASFQVQHYVHLIAAVHAELYRGQAASAWRRIHAAWPALRRALFLALESPRVELRNLRARAALALASATEPDRHWSRARLLRVAAREARRLARDADVASSRPFATLIQAGVAQANDQHERARQLLRDALAEFTAADMYLYAAAVRHRLGALTADRAGRDLQREADDWMRRQGIRNPVAMARVFAPVGDQTSGAASNDPSGWPSPASHHAA